MQQTPSYAAPSRSRRPKLSFRAFYITVLFISAFAVISLVADQSARYKHGPQYGYAQRRALEMLDNERLVKGDKECRLVHHAEDKCAFIKANCPDEEAGLLSYLSLYFCGLKSAQPVAFIILTLWLGLLFTTIGIAASDFFCINLSTIASILGMSESMAGVTFLAFGNGSPDVFSTFAAMSSHSGSLAVGELIGAAGFITAVVAGSMALVREFKVGKKTFVRDVGFFIVAASFSMMFLSDGTLHLWECCAMIGFYVFYVIVVVVWHWYLGRRRLRREREAAARGHYLAMPNDEIEVTGEDEEDEEAPAGQGRYRDTEDFGALERGASPHFGSQVDSESDEDEDQGLHLAAEMASSMRVTRPRGSRRNTITPIRPSLVGALEFRSVLASLQKSRGSHARSINLRRYSDDPTAANSASGYSDLSSLPERYSDTATSVIVTQHDESDDSSGAANSRRTRAVSMNDASSSKPQDPAAFSVATIPNIGIVAATPTLPRNFQLGLPSSTEHLPIPPSPTISLSPPPSISVARDISPVPSREGRKRDSLAPPDDSYPGAQHLRADHGRGNDSRHPRLEIPHSSSRDSSRSPTTSPILQFPPYTDSPLVMSARSSRAPSLMLPENALTLTYTGQDTNPDHNERPIKWWPYGFLPSPYVLLSTLFPTLGMWREKSIWDKFVSVISAPSIFLLAISLPVVESDPRATNEVETPIALDERTPLLGSRRDTIPALAPDSPSLEAEPEWIRYRRATGSPPHPPLMNGTLTGHGAAVVAVSAENLHRHNHPALENQKRHDSIGHVGDVHNESEPSGDWNRWLVSVQIFTAPLFTVVIIWANTDPTLGRLVRLVLYSLVGSLIAFAILIFTTTPSKRPRYRFLLCFLGFVVSIAWISTIANEVVGVLKAFGVILGISDAILGLTIFAVGNSLGDLVADITVARLGYPVMALSACFGGPMLNILLGIGISGLYMTLKEANHKHAKNPSHEIKYKPYRIEVSRTLMVSAITLLVTLVGLLIAVPLNKWVMSRRIGYGLISLWTISTIANLGVEISGWGNST
ncbi:Sodium/calcium exchanger protein-domain-containing protein [Amylocarpus encephaloides]|uniref:Sodium/calcium exchanger protein-domain-containing protein n=1 Tax=Amylocarpus encephaloides TaxID=45428 RepID=A0A9P8C9C4_9HELO|nr:Sodium/calcium exchanger protein-domain-containing protein [Amylocarpus encephaloides]